MRKERAQAATETDQLAKSVGKVLIFVKANRQKVVLGLSGVLLSLALLSGVGLYRQKADREASLAFQTLKIDFQHLVENEGRDAALTQWLEAAPSTMAAMSGRASLAPLLWYARLAFEVGDFESAAAWYGRAAKGFGTDTPLKNIAWCGQGHALEQQGELDEAAQLYGKIRKSDSSVKRHEATFHLARIKKAQGELSMAKGLYREILEDGASSYYQNISREKVAGL